MKHAMTSTAGLLLALSLGACAGTHQDDQQLGMSVADALVAACPMAAPSDENARALCAANLSDNKYLTSVMAEPFLWGGQGTLGDYHLEDASLNRFNILVWRRMYLSTFMFPGSMRVETTSDGITVVHLAVGFRNQLEQGSYPYPFWHSKKKWDSYQRTSEMLLIFQAGQWTGAMRSADLDMTRPEVSHVWSGQWISEEGNVQMPYVSVYSYLFSSNNPGVARVDAAFRALSNGLRAHSCVMCHSPDNYANVAQLEQFVFPNQALFSRNSIIAHLQTNTMPPPGNTLGLPAGIADDQERQALIALAQEFKAAGDAALAFEGELKPVQ